MENGLIEIRTVVNISTNSETPFDDFIFGLIQNNIHILDIDIGKSYFFAIDFPREGLSSNIERSEKLQSLVHRFEQSEFKLVNIVDRFMMHSVGFSILVEIFS